MAEQDGKRTQDGSAGDVDYGVIGRGYANYRQPDPRIAAAISRALGDAKTVLNVGAGAGSYEPTDRSVTAVEPSESMRQQRPAHLARAIDATAESLPFPDDAFDAAMTTFSVHQWGDLAAGLSELRRVTRGPVVILTCDPDLVPRLWFTEYAPDLVAMEASRYPTLEALRTGLGGTVTVEPVPIPFDCTDGFTEAYYGRPERLLDVNAQLACSAFSFIDDDTKKAYTNALRRDLESGEWDRKHGHLRDQPTYEGSLVLVRAVP